MDHSAPVNVQPLAAGDLQAGIVQAQQVQHRGVQVGHVVPLAQGVVPEFIGGPVDIAPLQPRAGQPDGDQWR